VIVPIAGPRAEARSLEILGRSVLDRTLDTLKALPSLDDLILSPLPLAGRGRGEGNETVLVCEPNRPLLTLPMLTEFLKQSHTDRVAALASPAADTYKLVRAGAVERTLDRASLWEVQGLSRFNQGSFNAVQDLEAARAAGIPVRLVQGDPMNFAVRTADDCRVAELVLGK
jgi:2-C-methyl-D-erythritol 4-phosphate cytidylyltransferase